MAWQREPVGFLVEAGWRSYAVELYSWLTELWVDEVFSGSAVLTCNRSNAWIVLLQ